MDLHQNNNSDPRFDDHHYKNQRQSNLNLSTPNARRLVSLQLSSTLVCLSSFYALSTYLELNTILNLVISIGCSYFIISKTTNMITSVIDKVESHINNINQNKIEEFQLRENDLFKNLERPLNELNKKLVDSTSSIKNKSFKVIDGGKKAA